MKKYLVTGGAGFIGSSLAKKLIELGHSVIIVDNLSTGSLLNIPDEAKFIRGNCQSSDVIKKLSNYNFDAIFHVAGQSSGEVSFEDPVYDLDTNTRSTLMLLKLSRKIGCRKFIYASSMSVYGDHENLPVYESYICEPKSFYAVGKLASEYYLKIYADNKLKTTALRLFNVYGPGQNMTNMKQGMASIFLSMALNKNLINVKGDLNRFRDFIYIDDVVESFIKSLNRTGNNFEKINICSEKKILVKKLIDVISENFTNKPKINLKDGTPGDQFGIYGSALLAKKLLNWKGSIKFKDGMKKMIDWARTHQR